MLFDCRYLGAFLMPEGAQRGIASTKRMGVMPKVGANEEPWWESLPEDFDRKPYVTEIDRRHALKIKGAAAVDSVMRVGLSTAVLAAMTPHLLSRERLQRDLGNMEFYRGHADRGNLAEVFVEPSKNLDVRRLKSPAWSFKPEGVNCELLGFDGGYEALNPMMRDSYARFSLSNRAVAQYWHHPDGPRPTLIMTHGYTADSYRFNSAMFSLRWFYNHGYDILLNTMPFHGLRSARSDHFSGMSFFSHGFAHMNEAFLQSVHDLRAWIDYLVARGAPAIGVTGYSLGGYVTSLAASIDSRLAFAIPNSPAVLLPDMIMGWPMLGASVRRVFAREGVGLKNFRHLSALHCPLTWKPVLDPERLMVIGGAGDRFTSPRLVNTLHEHWGGSEMHWFPGNHLIHLHQAEYLRMMKRFMDDCSATSPLRR